MDQQTFSSHCDYFNMVHGVTLRAIDAFTDPDLDFRPKPVDGEPVDSGEQ